MTNGTSGDFTRGLARLIGRLTPATTRARRGLAVCSLLVLAPAVFVALPSSGTPESACAAMQRWASAYSGQRPTLDDIAQFTRAQRVAIFNAVSPDVRASLWQEQLRRFNQQSDLTPTQHALIEEGLSLTTPALYDKDASAKQAFRQFWTRAEKSFDLAPHKQGWMLLGSVVSVPPSAPTMWDRITAPYRANAAFGSCVCQVGNDPFCASGVCGAGGCAPVSWGCGPGSTDPCLGLCR